MKSNAQAIGKRSCEVTHARLDLFPYCNLNCAHCCARDLFKRQGKAYLGLEQAFELLDILRANSISTLNILGGEPFLYPHIDRLLDYACGQDFSVSVTTNGTALDSWQVNHLVDCGVRNVFVSIDGSCPAVNDAIRGEGVFRKVLSTTRALINRREHRRSLLNVNVNSVLTRVNAADVPSVIALCASEGVNTFKLLRLEPMGNAVRHAEHLALTPDQEFLVAEEVFSRIPDYPSLSFDILSNKPRYLEYFYERYGVAMPVAVCGCKACIREIYIDPLGNVSPCLSTSAPFTSRMMTVYRDYRVNAFQLRGRRIHEMPFFDDFALAFPMTPSTYRHYTPCSSCPYLTTLCYPCPLGSNASGFTDPLCMIATEKLARLEGGER